MIDLESSYLEMIKEILSEHVPECKVWIFGSRVKGRARRYSDIDLVIIGKEKLDWHRMEALRDALSESDLPYMVDLLNWHDISESFREVIRKQYEVLIP
ncbi:MAG: nucleotidyltransferase domain-containing protein [Bacillota bacterium]|nr:nucleotidyltransferase domain-containing protein [Bacillota bacterium]